MSGLFRESPGLRLSETKRPIASTNLIMVTSGAGSRYSFEFSGLGFLWRFIQTPPAPAQIVVFWGVAMVWDDHLPGIAMSAAMSPKSLITLVICVGCVGAAGPATAQSVAAPPAVAAEPLQWNDAWRGMRAWEYPTAVGLMAGAFGARFLL